VLAAVFLVLLGVEWRYRSGIARIAVVALALAAMLFVQPNAHRALRRAWTTAPDARVTQVADGRSVSEYQSGVLTMKRAVSDDVAMGDGTRRIAMLALIWLACSPVLRRVRAASDPTPENVGRK
jgi:uncharacterized membrane protein